MTKLSVGIIDYGVGNHSSIKHTLNYLGVSSYISDNQTVLKSCDLLLLPGVGAFRPAMEDIERKGLGLFLAEEVALHKPLIGICLGMQLLSEFSLENGHTAGLALIPGKVVPLSAGRPHIGWNKLTLQKPDPQFEIADEKYFYFNHSYAYDALNEFTVCTSVFGSVRFATVVRSGKVVGIQFHPEKSQRVGHDLLRSVIDGLCNA